MTLTPIAKAWVEGVRAFEAGRPRTSNPYSPLPMEDDQSVKVSASWFEGWDDAKIVLELSPKHLEVAHG